MTAVVSSDISQFAGTSAGRIAQLTVAGDVAGSVRYRGRDPAAVLPRVGRLDLGLAAFFYLVTGSG